MRRIIMMLLVCFALAPAALQSQGIESLQLQSVTIGSGQDAIASGITGTAVFAPADNKIYGEFTVQPEQAWVTLARNWGKKMTLTAGGSIGYFQGAPWVGPYIVGSIPIVSKVRLSALVWPAYFPAWEPDLWRFDGVRNPESTNLGKFGIVSLGTNRVKLTYAGLDFLDEPYNRLPGGSVTLPVAEKTDLTVNATWNGNKRLWMYYMGVTRSVR